MEERFNIETLDKMMDDIREMKIVPFSKSFRIVPPVIWNQLRENYTQKEINAKGVYLDAYIK